MPVFPAIPIHRLNQSEFGEVSFEVMKSVFAIHTEFGRFFDETIYKRELAQRMANVHLEVPVKITFDNFTRQYFLDVLVGHGGLFEFKTADALHPRHRAQLLHYLLLTGLSHAKLVNMRPEKVSHEFVNTTLNSVDLRQPSIQRQNWDSSLPGAAFFEETLRALIADWGTCLELPLYLEALVHFFGGESKVRSEVSVISKGAKVGVHDMHLASADIAFKLTALASNHDNYAIQMQRLLEHTNLKAILWANVTHRHVQFTCIR